MDLFTFQYGTGLRGTLKEMLNTEVNTFGISGSVSVIIKGDHDDVVL